MPPRAMPERVRKLHGLPPKHLNPVLPDLSNDPKPPSWLSAEAKKEWKRVLEATRKHPGWLQVVDRAALTAYCTHWSVFEAAAKDVAKRGHLVPGRSSADEAKEILVKNPSVQIMRDAGVQMRGWVKELGFSPDSRGRIDLEPEQTEDDARTRELLS
jgi:P27 family predicted phage terminase small subunit